MLYCDPPSGALKAATNGIHIGSGAMFWPSSRVPFGQMQLRTAQKRWFWNAMALSPASSWTLARPSVETVTTSPAVELTVRTVLDRSWSEPVQPGAG